MASANEPAPTSDGFRRRAVVVARAGLGPLLAGAALGLIVLEPALRQGMLLLFTLAVLIAAWVGGFAAGALAAVTAVLGGRWLGLPPLTRLTLAEVTDQVQLLLFALVAAGASAFGYALQRARRASTSN